MILIVPPVARPKPNKLADRAAGRNPKIDGKFDPIELEEWIGE